MLNNWIDTERLIHSVKTAIACIIGIALTKIISFPADQWIVITIIVVMCAQIYVGSVVQKAYVRFLGTLIGCLFAMIAVVFFGDSGFVVAGTIGFASLVFSYFATASEALSAAATLGAVTTAIIMLGNSPPTFTYAAERFLEISVGLFIAAVVSQFILPIHARTHLRRSQASTLEQLKNLYTELMITPHQEDPLTDTHHLDENIVKLLLKQRQLAKESTREPFGIDFKTDHFQQTLFCERDILRAMIFMHQAFIHINQDAVLSTLPELTAFNHQVLETLNALKKVIETHKSTHTTISVPALEPLKRATQEHISPASQETWTYVNGFLFSAEILVHGLATLANLYQAPLPVEDNAIIG